MAKNRKGLLDGASPRLPGLILVGGVYHVVGHHRVAGMGLTIDYVNNGTPYPNSICGLRLGSSYP